MKTVLNENGELVEVTDSEQEEPESGDEIDPVTGKIILKKRDRRKPRTERDKIVNPYDERYVKERSIKTRKP